MTDRDFEEGRGVEGSPKLKEVWDILDRWQVPDPPHSMRAAILASTTDIRKGRNPLFLRWGGWALAAAALVALVITVGPESDKTGGPEPGRDTVLAPPERLAHLVDAPPAALISDIEILEELEVLEALRDLETFEEIVPAEQDGDGNRLGSASGSSPLKA